MPTVTNFPILYCFLSRNATNTFHSNIKDMRSVRTAR